MDLFIPLIIFWVVSAVVRGMQNQQSSQPKGGPLPRPRPAQQPERPDSKRAATTGRTGSAPRSRDVVPAAPVPLSQRTGESSMSPENKWEKGRREPRLVKEGEVPRQSRLTAQEPAAGSPQVGSEPAQQVQGQLTDGVGRKESGSPLDRIRKDLKDPRSLQAAIYYSEIFSAPRAHRPYRPPHMR